MRQLDHAEKKVQSSFICQTSPSRSKYLLNIFYHLFRLLGKVLISHIQLILKIFIPSCLFSDWIITWKKLLQFQLHCSGLICSHEIWHKSCQSVDVDASSLNILYCSSNKEIHSLSIAGDISVVWYFTTRQMFKRGSTSAGHNSALKTPYPSFPIYNLKRLVWP